MSTEFAPPPPHLGLVFGRRLRLIAETELNPPVPVGTEGKFLEQIYYGKWWRVQFDGMAHPHSVYPFDLELLSK